MLSKPLIAAIEAGGTKFVCAVARLSDAGPAEILARQRIPTGADAAATSDACIAWFMAQQSVFGAISALGIASFGPVDLARHAIGRTPKPGWSGFALGERFKTALGVPVGFDTDVNAAAWAETRWGAGQGHDPLIYLTIGTGLGGGAVIDGRILHGAVHPEMGHLRPARAQNHDFPGICPFHGACWEGLCSGPAVAARWGQPAETLPADHPGWAIWAAEMAESLQALTAILSPRRIILGGSVAKGGKHDRAQLMQRIATTWSQIDRGYLSHPDLVAPGLGDDAGILGAVLLGVAVLP